MVLRVSNHSGNGKAHGSIGLNYSIKPMVKIHDPLVVTNGAELTHSQRESPL
jgi:hypothetical protein